MPISDQEWMQLWAARRAGDRAASERIDELIYDELRSAARKVMTKERHGHTLQATALAHETWFRLPKLLEHEPASLGDVRRLVTRAMRRMLIDHARKRAALKHGEGQVLELPDTLAITARQVVWTADLADAFAELARRDDRACEVAVAHLLVGLTIEQIAKDFGLAHDTVRDDWRYASAELNRLLKSYKVEQRA